MTLTQERKRNVPIIQVVTRLLTAALNNHAESATQVEHALFRTTVFEALPQDTKLRMSMRASLLDQYRAKARQLVRNLKMNATLRDALLRGGLSADKVVMMDAQDLNPSARFWVERAERRKARKAKKEEEDAAWRAEREAARQSATSTKEICPKCNTADTEHYQMQTRSADEPMTIFYHCLNCENRWKR